MTTHPESIGILRQATLDKTPVSLGPRRTASPHEFYRYPARFSPAFAAAAIEAFTLPNHLVLDPFVGGGTTAVEAQRLGRRALVADLNSLAAFVTKVKTTLLSGDQRSEVSNWLERVRHVRLTDKEPPLGSWDADGYFKDLKSPATWRLRKLISLWLARLPGDPDAKDFARCIVLRSAQWALDMRSTLPSSDELRETLQSVGEDMLGVAEACSEQLCARPAPEVYCQGVPGLSGLIELDSAPILVLTSPPYPGVYVNYHRWKMLGRREIRAPYWITNTYDGRGLSHYTMAARSDPTLDTYFSRLRDAFADVVRLLGAESVVVQMVGFNNREVQLPRYLKAMEAAGLEEIIDSDLATEPDGRLWRSVPGRRWWTEAHSRRGLARNTADEVVLLHRPARH